MGLAHPVSSKVLTRHGNANFKIGAASMQGFRTEMEDAHTINMAMSKHTSKAFFGVFDGHNGDVCAHWSAEHLWPYVDELEELSDEAIQKACLAADDNFLKNDPDSASGSMGGGSGCTAVFVVADVNGVDGYDLTIANIGDSRALLGRGGKTVELTEDHKPTNVGEQKRIVAAGGFVQAARVDGQLALSRAMGDSQYKQNASLPADEQKVIAKPDITKEKLGKNDFLLICCDGIFESFSNSEAVEFVANQLKTSDDLAMIMAKLLDAVLAAGSKDNMTAVLILPVDGTSYHKEKDEFLPGVFHEHRANTTFAQAYTTDARKHGYTLEEAMELLELNASKGYYKPSPVQSRGNFLLPFFAAAASGGLKDDDEGDDPSDTAQ